MQSYGAIRFVIFWHRVSQIKWKLEGKIGFLKTSASHPCYSATCSNILKKYTQILPMSRCMHNFSSLLYLFWHLQRGPFSRIFGKISFLHLTLLNFIFFVNFREGKVCRFFYTNDLGQFSNAETLFPQFTPVKPCTLQYIVVPCTLKYSVFPVTITFH